MNPQDAARILKFGRFEEPENLTSDAGQLHACWVGAQRILDDHQAQFAQEKASGLFTEAGLKARAVELRKATEERLAKLERDLIAPRAKGLEALKANAKVKKVSEDPADMLRHELQLQEIRRHLLSMSQADLLVVVSDALSSSDRDVLMALDSTPGVMRRGLFPDDRTWDRVHIAADALDIDPAKAQEIKVLEGPLALASGAIQTVREEIQAVQDEMNPDEAMRARLQSQTRE